MHEKHLTEALLMSTCNICHHEEIRKIFTWYPVVSRTMCKQRAKVLTILYRCAGWSESKYFIYAQRHDLLDTASVFVLLLICHSTQLFACWVILHAFLSSVDFFQNKLYQKNLSGLPSVLNTLDLDQTWCFVRPDLGPNCFQRLSADDKSRH